MKAIRTSRAFVVMLLAASAPAVMAGPDAAGHGPAKATVSKAALDQLVKAAGEAHSDALVVLHKGETVGEWYFGGKSRPIETMSVTKSIVNLIMGRLRTLGRIDSIDTPVAKFYPEWNQGHKKEITLRHLLNHTSGLQNVPRADIEIYPSPDVVQLALAAELSNPPGEHWSYNNKAVNLLAGVIEKATGKPMDVIFRETLAEPLGIESFQWMKDKAGNPYAMAGLQLHARDLAKLGQLVANRGRWKGVQLINESWLAESLAPATKQQANCGLLWWLIYDTTRFVIDDVVVANLASAGVPKSFVEKVKSARGTYSDRKAYFGALQAAFGSNWQAELNETLAPLGVQLSRKEYGKLIGYRADGYLGQYIVIYPDQELVAVRLVASSDDYNPETDGLPDFPELVRQLVKSP